MTFFILRVRGMDAPDASALFPSSMLQLKNNPYSSPPAAPAGKWGPTKVHAPVPFRPQPINSQKFAQSWHVPDNPDWVTMSIMADDGTVIHHNTNIVPAKIHNLSGQSAQERVLNAQRLWTDMNAAMRSSSGPQRSLSEQDQGPGDPNLEETMRPSLTSVSEPKQSWETPDAKDSALAPIETVDDGPLDLSEAGRAKAVKTPQEALDRVISPADSPRSTSSSSAAAPSSSSMESSASQSEQRLGELIWLVRNVQASLGSRPTAIKLSIGPGNKLTAAHHDIPKTPGTNHNCLTDMRVGMYDSQSMKTSKLLSIVKP